ncbi:MAG: polysaccharide deacetylase family protein [bacterium]
MELIKTVIFLGFFYSQIITGFQSDEKAVAFTFDACETVTPAYFDKDLLDFILNNKIPVTLFLSGKFIERNLIDLRTLSKYEFIEIENHSYSHWNFREINVEVALADVKKNEALITEVTGRKPLFFRFPYGEYRNEILKGIEKAGYKVVHWAFPSGDPDKSITKEQLVEAVVKKAKNGDVLIFHINGRGWKTKEAFPEIVKILKEKGYRFYLLKDVLKQ